MCDILTIPTGTMRLIRDQNDYTRGKLDELLDVIIEGGAKLFVSAVGVPPEWAVEKLHKAGILYMVCVNSADMARYSS